MHINVNCFVRFDDEWFVVEQICSESIRVRNVNNGYSNWAFIYEIDEVKYVN
jgi:hypothetical protein